MITVYFKTYFDKKMHSCMKSFFRRPETLFKPTSDGIQVRRCTGDGKYAPFCRRHFVHHERRVDSGGIADKVCHAVNQLCFFVKLQQDGSFHFRINMRSVKKEWKEVDWRLCVKTGSSFKG